jgi:hypothetical protein
VSVAGLIALGPLTDSLGTSVSFPQSVPVYTSGAATSNAPVPVSLTRGIVGATETAALTNRGGRAADTKQATVASDTGFVVYRKRATVKATPAAPVKPEKKAPKRRVSIGEAGETNPDAGLAGGAPGAVAQGESAVTPAP